MTANDPGSRPSSSVDLYSFDAASTSTLPNAATLTVPACHAVGKFVGTVSLDQVTPPDVYVAFVFDRSGSMGSGFTTTAPTPTKLSVAQTAVKNAIDDIYTGFGTHAHIGLVGFATGAGTGLCSSRTSFSLDSCDTNADCTKTGETCGQKLPFEDETQASVLENRVAAFTASGITSTDLALKSAKAMLDAVPNADNQRRIIVLLTDDSPQDVKVGTETTTQTAARSETLAESAADSVKGDAKTIELYTVGLTTSTTLVSNMKVWSSNTPVGSRIPKDVNSTNGVNYAYHGNDANAINGAYTSIDGTITGVTVSMISSDADGTHVSRGVVHAGANQTLPFPSAFRCDGVHEQQVPLQATFAGSGKVTISDVHIDYCAP